MENIELYIWYPALLFPAIPIMLLVFTNKYTALAMLIRKLHVLSYDNSGNYLSAERIQILSFRLVLLRWMQTLSGISFLLNLLTIFFGYIDLMNIALNFFGVAVFILSIAIILFIIESQQSHYALNLHLRDLEEYNKNNLNKVSSPPGLEPGTKP
tara:strand:+ start:30 stop:494 length:465 start_codon:yes stop_codon:yes gene_type:complete